MFLLLVLHLKKNIVSIMLKTSTFISRLLPTQIQLQTIRWKRQPRKPFWLGTAKSKRFIIPEQPNLPPEERIELRRLDGQYRTSMRTIRYFFFNLDTEKSELHTASQDEIETSLLANEDWNKKSADLREERMLQKSEEHSSTVKSVIDKYEKREKELLSRIEEIVVMEKENSKSFITPDNVDIKIEECLSSIADYNYAIDLQGQMYTGYEDNMKSTSLDLDYCKTDQITKST